MQGSAQYPVGEEIASEATLATGAALATGTDGATTLFDTGASSLREAAAARIAAHRNKRAGAHAPEAAREDALRLKQAQRDRTSRRGTARVRDAVRARYEQSQSYRDFLAAEAERAIGQARVEAEVAARSAKAIAEAQMQLLEELRVSESASQQVSESVRSPAGDAFVWAKDRAAAIVQEAAEACESGDLFAEPDSASSVKEISTGGLTVRLYEDVRPASTFPESKARRRALVDDAVYASEELEHLEQEIAFRRAPEFAEHILETLPIPANLIEFPRELVATRKARPRLAEGPLREELVPEPQLRIFEVEPDQISTAPPAADEVAAEAPVWQGMMLGATPLSASFAPIVAAETRVAMQLVDIAPISRRLMAAAVDACCVGVAMVGFWTVAAWISGPRLAAMSKPMLGVAVLFALALAAVVYQVLFFCLNEATPGMRYARIALCTFAETTPSRQAMRRRLMAMMLAACPLGLGLVWAWMDDDRLAWHDRMSRMYQRVY